MLGENDVDFEFGEELEKYDDSGYLVYLRRRYLKLGWGLLAVFWLFVTFIGTVLYIEKYVGYENAKQKRRGTATGPPRRSFTGDQCIA